ncbi:LysR family transcriptional regulator [Pseudaestuariivita atlantica]|uniref:LysR family transcriptional regulator n=1 Tax=Pseudaestuariivita atlantica TaxID=1317121 RepID=A0A0L1JRX5_9RHOB|nr:LysR family transcriptional regulator [Pseudaestuariivita atlantica]KNG94500.1 LysR family transcriptional regulator [Pseudaestuariivita atlantica]
MNSWDEIRTAYHVARMGTVSGAADALGVHHATVIRHIDALEQRLGAKLFQRHARGYTATEAGEDLLRVAQTTDDQFSQLTNRIKGRGAEVAGELVVTSVESMGPQLVPVLAEFQAQHPQLSIRYLTGSRLLRLEYGEAHVAIRAGNPPDQPDNVVQPFFRMKFAMYAAKSYGRRHGFPERKEDLRKHRFVAFDETGARAPFSRWLRDHVPAENVVFVSGDSRVLENAVYAGAGIGFLPVYGAVQRDDLVRVIDPDDSWTVPVWLVTHVDLHRSAKVQALLSHLKAQIKRWDVE